MMYPLGVGGFIISNAVEMIEKTQGVNPLFTLKPSKSHK